MFLTTFIISFAASIISSSVLNLPIPTLIDELIVFLSMPIFNKTCEGFGEDEVHAEPDEIEILGNELIIDCPLS